jgi:adenylate cyclase
MKPGGSVVRQVRLISGLLLFAFVVCHLVNHALGLVSLDSLEAGRSVFGAVWGNPVSLTVVMLALSVHLLLALWAVYQRRTLRMRPIELVQLFLGLAVPFLLLNHMMGTALAKELAGTNTSYAWILLLQWHFDPSYLVSQPLGLIAAWVHGCIGIYQWIRLKPWFPKVSLLLFSGGLLVPVLALLGYANAGREVLVLAESRIWVRDTLAQIGPPDSETLAAIVSRIELTRYTIVALIAVALAARPIRDWLERRRGYVHVTYPGGRTVGSIPGRSILDISRINGVPHASVCGGRGRCSTCRVRILKGADLVASPSPQETRVLERIGHPINVRLACQAFPVSDIEIVPLLPPTATARDGFPKPARLQGEEREVAVLFADLRSFTQFSEKKLPYDVVFVLNRYFANMGHAIEDAGGHLDKFIGDGVMALFGLNEDAATAARQALKAAEAMSRSLADLNRAFSDDLDEPLRIGIGIHLGPAIVGEMGYGDAVSVTAIGDTVNTASRLETLTKEYGAQLVVSSELAARGGVDLTGFPSHTVKIRGRSEEMEIRVVLRADSLGRIAPA